MTRPDRRTPAPFPYLHPGRTIALVALAAFMMSFGFLLPSSASAQTLMKEKEKTTAINDRVSLEMYGGYVKGESREIVYNAATGHMISQLFWTIDEAYVVGGNLSVRANDWLTFRLGGWTPFKSSNTMNDYDWQLTGHGDWSDLSHHPDTRIDHAVMIDAGAKARVVSFGKTALFDRAGIDLLTGFRFFNISFTAYGGSGVYSAGGFRNGSTTFTEGQAGLAYEQWFNTPYVGVGGNLSKGRLTFTGEITGSLWGWGSDKDNHYDRTLLFESQYSRVNMAACDFSLAYAVSKNLDFVGRFAYTKYFESQAPVTAQDYAAGTTQHASGNAEGMDHQNMLFSLGLRWRIF